MLATRTPWNCCYWRMCEINGDGGNLFCFSHCISVKNWTPSSSAWIGTNDYSQGRVQRTSTFHNFNPLVVILMLFFPSFQARSSSLHSGLLIVLWFVWIFSILFQHQSCRLCANILRLHSINNLVDCGNKGWLSHLIVSSKLPPSPSGRWPEEFINFLNAAVVV